MRIKLKLLRKSIKHRKNYDKTPKKPCGIVRFDILKVDGVKRNPFRVKLLMRSYSRYIASDAKVSNFRADMAANDLDTVDDDTIFSYFNALKRNFVVEDLPAWSPNFEIKNSNQDI